MRFPWGCGCEMGVLGIKKIIKGQVFDIPEPEIIVTEHRVAVKECPECQAQHTWKFSRICHSTSTVLFVFFSEFGLGLPY